MAEPHAPWLTGHPLWEACLPLSFLSSSLGDRKDSVHPRGPGTSHGAAWPSQSPCSLCCLFAMRVSSSLTCEVPPWLCPCLPPVVPKLQAEAQSCPFCPHSISGACDSAWDLVIAQCIFVKNEQTRNNGVIISAPAGNFALPEGRLCHFDAPFCSRWRNQTSAFFLASVFPNEGRFWLP